MTMKSIITFGYTKHTPSRGVWGHAPQENLKNKCYKIESGSNFGQSFHVIIHSLKSVV